MWTLEVNEIALRLQRDGAQLYDEPGIAYVNDSTPLYGNAALAQLFVHPVQCQTTFWQRMNDDALDQGTKTIGKYSDLVYRQVDAMFQNSGIQRDESGWVVIPSDLDTSQVGMLYGILDYRNIKPRGFVDAAAVASAESAISRHTFYIELQLERAIVTQLRPNGDELDVGNVKTIANAGYIQLAKRWIDAVARESLEQTRFDPRVSGDTEQQVFERLRERIHGEEIVVAVEHNGETRSQNLNRATLASNSVDVYERIVSECEPNAHVLLGEHAAGMPGFHEFIVASGRSVEFCQLSSIGSTLAHLDAQVPVGADVDLYKSLNTSGTLATPQAKSRPEAAREPTPHPQPHAEESPTHALLDSEARPIGEHAEITVADVVACVLTTTDGRVRVAADEKLAACVNGRLLRDETELRVGDRITFNAAPLESKEIVLIRVVNDG